MSDDGKALFGYAEFARRIDMSEGWVRKNVRSLPHHKVGRRVKFSDECVEAFKARTHVNPYQLRQSERSRKAVR